MTTGQNYVGGDSHAITNESTANPAAQSAQNQDQTPQSTFTSTGKDYSRSNYWSFSLDIESKAERSDKLLPRMLSGAEIVLDALQKHRDELMKEFGFLFDAWAKDDGATIGDIRKEPREGEFIEYSAPQILDSF